MSRYVKFITAIMSLLFPVLLCAQEDIKVESFAQSTTTNFANTPGHIEYDDNGEKCALIIVDTKHPELLTFDGGSLGIKKVVPKTGQVWLYVPNGLKRLTISGENMGTLRDYDLGLSVVQARTYILKLTTKDVETIVFNDSIQTMMRIKVVSEKDNTPIADADFSLNGIKEVLNQNGVFEKQLSGALYRYRVESTYYKTESGTFVVDGKSNEHIIKMKPNYEIASIKAPKGCEIWIDGKLMGKDSWNGKLILGTHSITTKLDKHYDDEQTITVVEGSPVNISLDNPKEIQGTLNVVSTPIGAKVFVNNQKQGITPCDIPYIIGNHTIEIRREGYTSVIEKVSIQENQTHRINATLSLTHKVKITSSPNRASVSLDGKQIGNTPLEVEMRSGSHNFAVNSPGYYTLERKEQIGDNQTEIKFRLKRQHYKSFEGYLGGGYRIMPISGLQGTLGGYLYNINVEFGYLKGSGKSEAIYWYTPGVNMRPTMATYGSTMYQLRVGYGWALNNTFRITPQVGGGYIVLTEITESDEVYANGAYATSFTAGIKIDCAFSKWWAITFVPEYSIAMKKSEGFQLLEGLSTYIKGLSSGLGLNVNLNVRF